MTPFVRLAATTLLMASAASACLPAATPSASSPASTSAPSATTGPPPPADIQATLAWLQERTFTCTELAAGDGIRRWECTATSTRDDGRADELKVTVQRDLQGATHLVATLDATQALGSGLCPGTICDPYTGFFSDTIARAPLTGPSGPAIAQWVDAHARTGGQVLLGNAAVAFVPAPPVFRMTIDIAAGP